MKAFKKAMEELLEHEGYYVYDPDDAGGETYRGISRRYFPGWTGWTVIDENKISNTGLDRVYARLSLDVEDHYKHYFWNRFAGDSVAVTDSNLAVEVFEQAVLFGVHRSVSHLQEAINALNRDEMIFRDIEVDGVFGKQTKDALYHLDAINNIELLRKVMNIIQGRYCLERMKARSKNEKYVGWFNRVKL